MITQILRRGVVVMVLGVLLALAAPIGAGATAHAADTGGPVGMSRVALAQETFDAIFNGNDPTEAAFLLTDDAAIHTGYGEFTGPQGLNDYVAFVKRTYPDAVFDITGISVQGNRIDVSWTMSATRIQVDPVEQPVEAVVRQTGTTTLTVDGARITDLAHANGEMTISEPVELGGVITGGICTNPCV
jgi:hypothetical protein